KGGGHFWAAPWEIDDEFGGFGLPQDYSPLTTPTLPKLSVANGGNTTIAIVATDAPLHKSGCLRMATAAQDGMGRALVPAHTPFDGDLVFGVSTHHWQGEMSIIDPIMIGHAASICLSRAIARGVYEASAAPHDPMPCFRDIKFSGASTIADEPTAR
ncbi:MAG: P1 family peptidase, partial [Alphaproteobacteria bacterium]|nr:P1 family peptidase [Alphaproteobacteria bacterium]